MKSTKNIDSYISKWKILNDKNVNISLTDKLEFYIIELPKFEKYKDKENNFQIEKWVNFIRNPEGDEMDKNDEAIQKARKVLNEISQDKYEREMAELRLKYIMEMKSQERYGYDQGVEKTKTEIAKKMKAQKLDIDLIISITGLTKEEIEML